MIEKSYRDAFDCTFNESAFSPSYELRYLYSFPSFQITFKTDEELNMAKSVGITNEFNEKIYSLCKDRGTQSNPFDVETAVWFTSTEELDSINKNTPCG